LGSRHAARRLETRLSLLGDPSHKPIFRYVYALLLCL
jgi:hypothetical protein